MIKEFIFIGDSCNFLNTSFIKGNIYHIDISYVYRYNRDIFFSMEEHFRECGVHISDTPQHIINKEIIYKVVEFGYEMDQYELDQYFIELSKYRSDQIDMILGEYGN